MIFVKAATDGTVEIRKQIHSSCQLAEHVNPTTNDAIRALSNGEIDEYINKSTRILIEAEKNWLIAHAMTIYGKRLQVTNSSLRMIDLLQTPMLCVLETEAKPLRCDVVQIAIPLSELGDSALELPEGYYACMYLLEKPTSESSPDTINAKILTGFEPWLENALIEAKYLTAVEFPSNYTLGKSTYHERKTDSQETIHKIQSGKAIATVKGDQYGRAICIRSALKQTKSAPSFIWASPKVRGTSASNHVLDKCNHFAGAKNNSLLDVISISNPRSLALFTKQGFSISHIVINKAV